MKRKYEGVIVLNTQGREDSVDDLINSVGKEIEGEGAKLEQIDRMGRKEFAYTPRKLNVGYYVNYFFEADPAAIDKIQTKLKLNEEVFLQYYLRLN
ncbi:MAG: 30S ribosomal protein S6 [Verrucomicrobiota bacterium]